MSAAWSREEDVNRVGRALSGAARVAFLRRELIAAEDTLRQLTAEVVGVLDILTGVPITNAEQRLDAHLRRIAELSEALPRLDEREGVPVR